MNLRGVWETDNGPTWLMSYTSINEVLSLMRDLIEQWRAAPEIRNLALDIIKQWNVASRDTRAQALAIATWVQQTIFYVLELPERIQTPGETLRLRAGDCDDMTTLIGALCESIGIPVLIVCMHWDGDWRHVFPAIELPTGLLPLEVTMSDYPVAEVPSAIDWANKRAKSLRLKLA